MAQAVLGVLGKYSAAQLAIPAVLTAGAGYYGSKFAYNVVTSSWGTKYNKKNVRAYQANNHLTNRAGYRAYYNRYRYMMQTDFRRRNMMLKRFFEQRPKDQSAENMRKYGPTTRAAVHAQEPTINFKEAQRTRLQALAKQRQENDREAMIQNRAAKAKRQAWRKSGFNPMNWFQKKKASPDTDEKPDKPRERRPWQPGDPHPHPPHSGGRPSGNFGGNNRPNRGRRR